MKNKLEGLAIIMQGLMQQYSERVPDVEKIIKGMLNKGIIQSRPEIENDHIAFRTIGVPMLGIQSLENIFCHYGYAKKDYFRFDSKKLDAYWFSPPSPAFPRIFISELKVEELPQEIQDIILSYTKEVVKDPLDDIDLDDAHAVSSFLHTPLWKLPKLADYLSLLKASEYAAWVIYNRYYLNHYTISVHQLKDGYNSLSNFNHFLESIGIQLNDAGGKIKVSGDGLLLQSSTVAQIIEAAFDNNETHPIAGSYVEFAERRVLPAFETIAKDQLQRIHFRDGFETSNADKIFESTFVEQINKNVE